MPVSDPRLDGLYLLTDAGLCRESGIVPAVEAALRGGVRLVQYRDKSTDHRRRSHEAREIARACRDVGALFIVNDDAELAAAVNADGVHLGRDDATVETARALLGDDAIVGVSCYNDFERAWQASAAGASYVAFGSVFSSPVKPDAPRAPLEIFGQARDRLDIPACAIGGIDADNIEAVSAAGADMFAVISSILAADDIEKAARALNAGIRSGRGEFS